MPPSTRDGRQRRPLSTTQEIDKPREDGQSFCVRELSARLRVRLRPLLFHVRLVRSGAPCGHPGPGSTVRDRDRAG